MSQITRGKSVLLVLSLCLAAYVLYPEHTASRSDNCVSKCDPDCENICRKIYMIEGSLAVSCNIATPRNATSDKCVCEDLPDKQKKKQSHFHHILICDEQAVTSSTTAYLKIASIGIMSIIQFTVALYFSKPPSVLEVQGSNTPGK